jgi:hypothetical protein
MLEYKIQEENNTCQNTSIYQTFFSIFGFWISLFGKILLVENGL